MENGMTGIEDFTKFMEDNQEIVRRILRPYRGLGEYDILAEEASLGMAKGFLTYSTDREIDLTEYAFICAKNEVQAYLRRERGVVTSNQN